MYSEEKLPGSNLPCCLWCFSTDKLSRCGRCGIAYYCSRNHQVQHWKIHKLDCKPVQTQVPNESNVSSSSDFPQNAAAILPVTNVASVTVSNEQPGYSGWVNNNIVETKNVQVTDLTKDMYESAENLFATPDETLQTGNIYGASETKIENIFTDAVEIEANKKMYQFPLEGNSDMFSSLSSELLSSTNNYWDVVTNCETANLSLNFELGDPSGKTEEKILQPPLEDSNFASAEAAMKSDYEDLQDSYLPLNVTLEDICLNIISDLNEYGICVIDKFLGSKLGDLIAAEVKSLFMKGIFKKGELVNSGMWQTNENIRGDVITWVNGTEPGCHHIGNLIKKLDVLMTACNKMPDNGILSRYKLNRRTKAMIACYPGDGTHYKKHVDNPHGDGRCITCIYYLNKKWNTKVHGGLLRMFPIEHESEVANIEPIFDRMLFFWSDRRNPHEVLPSYNVRFAITVWYFDSDERDCALMKYRTQEK